MYLWLRIMNSKKQYLVWLLIAMVFFTNSDLFAQGCSMCKAVVESNINGGGTEASGLNFGILYLMVFPYIIISVIAILWRKHQKSLEELN